MCICSSDREIPRSIRGNAQGNMWQGRRIRVYLRSWDSAYGLWKISYKCSGTHLWATCYHKRLLLSFDTELMEEGARTWPVISIQRRSKHQAFLWHDWWIIISPRGWCTCWHDVSKGPCSHRPWAPSWLFRCHLCVWYISHQQSLWELEQLL